MQVKVVVPSVKNVLLGVLVANQIRVLCHVPMVIIVLQTGLLVFYAQLATSAHLIEVLLHARWEHSLPMEAVAVPLVCLVMPVQTWACPVQRLAFLVTMLTLVGYQVALFVPLGIFVLIRGPHPSHAPVVSIRMRLEL